MTIDMFNREFTIPGESQKTTADFHRPGTPGAMHKFMRDVGAGDAEDKTKTQERAQAMPAMRDRLVFQGIPAQGSIQKSAETQKVMRRKLPEQNEIGDQQQGKIGKEKAIQNPGVPVLALIKIRGKDGIAQGHDADDQEQRKPEPGATRAEGKDSRHHKQVTGQEL
jgi:hypothetical protein